MQEFNPIINRARVARLATADSKAKPHIVPVVFAFDGEKYFIPIEEKTKTTKPGELRRIKNIDANPAVALLIDEYNEDWKKLLFIMVEDGGGEGEHGDVKLLKKAHKLLYTKYPQYQHIDIGKLSIVIYPQKTIFWSMLSRENK
jgi:PPOX class probable F420-dependent enzyme